MDKSSICNSADMASHREEWCDVIKGILVAMVVLCHCILTVGCDTAIQKAAVIFVYSFHMPLFFIISGYFFKACSLFGAFVLKKIKALMLPYFLFILIDSIAEIVFGVYTIETFWGG